MVVNAPTSNIISRRRADDRPHPEPRPPHPGGARAAWPRGSGSAPSTPAPSSSRRPSASSASAASARSSPRGCRRSASRSSPTTPTSRPARAQQLGVQLLSLDELLERADFITIHMPKTPETTGMIGTEQFGPDEADGVRRQRRPRRPDRRGRAVRGARPPARSPAPASTSSSRSRPTELNARSSLPNVVVTPHLGASTDEAQEKAGVSVARSVRLALEGELVPDAVNVAGGVIDPYVRPGITLVEKLGQVFAALAGHGALDRASTSRCAASSPPTTSACYRLAALKGILHEHRQRERLVRQRARCSPSSAASASKLNVSEESKEYRNIITLRGALSDGTSLAVAGTLIGHEAGREAHRHQRLRHRGADRGAPHRDALHRPSRHRRDLRPGVRRGGHQHRRHADRAPRRGRPGAQHPHRRLAGARRSCSRRSAPRSTPTWSARSTSSSRSPFRSR